MANLRHLLATLVAEAVVEILGRVEQDDMEGAGQQTHHSILDARQTASGSIQTHWHQDMAILLALLNQPEIHRSRTCINSNSHDTSDSVRRIEDNTLVYAEVRDPALV